MLIRTYYSHCSLCIHTKETLRMAPTSLHMTLAVCGIINPNQPTMTPSKFFANRGYLKNSCIIPKLILNTSSFADRLWSKSSDQRLTHIVKVPSVLILLVMCPGIMLAILQKWIAAQINCFNQSNSQALL